MNNIRIITNRFRSLFLTKYFRRIRNVVLGVFNNCFVTSATAPDVPNVYGDIYPTTFIKSKNYASYDGSPLDSTVEAFEYSQSSPQL